MNIAIIGLLIAVIASPMLLCAAFSRVKKVLYSGPATVHASTLSRNRQGMLPVTLVVPGIAPFNFEISVSRFMHILDGENQVMVSVARRLLDSKTVINQILWKYEVNQAAKDGRYDKISPDRPVDQDLGIIPGLVYFGLSLGSVALFVGDNFVASLMRSDPTLMHAFWYGNAACVTLCGYWLASKQPHIRGYLSEGGSRWLLMVMHSIIGGFAALGAIMFYEEPSPLIMLGAICACAVGTLIAMVAGAFKSHPSTASPMAMLDLPTLYDTSRTSGDAARLIASPEFGRHQKILP